MRHHLPYHQWFRDVADAYERGLEDYKRQGKSPAPINGVSVFTGVKEDYDAGTEPKEVATAILEGRHATISNPRIAC